MLIYGVCISEIKEINQKKVEKFLAELAEKGFPDYLKEFKANKEDNNGDYTVGDYLYDYASNGYYGLSAFLRDIIEKVEGINISCEDPNGIHYLGIAADMPWYFNEKTRNLSDVEYIQIMAKYVSKVTDETLDIRWWNVCDDCDY